jgi:hypothetical protein
MSGLAALIRVRGLKNPLEIKRVPEKVEVESGFEPL